LGWTTYKLWKAAVKQGETLKDSLSIASRSAKAAEKSAEAAHKSAEALPKMERAYLFITNVEANNAEQRIYIRLENAGKTPAISTQIFADFVSGNTCPQQKDDRDGIPPIAEIAVISAGSKSRESIFNTIGNIHSPEMIVSGTVVYEDLFERKKHRIRFCWHMDRRKSITFYKCSSNKARNSEEYNKD
jgi:hypothetical protein